MITVSVKKLIDTLKEAEAFTLPNMNTGVEYLYENLYQRLLKGEDVRLSEINFNSFDLDDIDSLRDMYNELLEAYEDKTERVDSTLRNSMPVAAVSAFV